MSDDSKQIEALTAKVNALERQLSGADVGSEKEVAAWRDAQHTAAERRAARHNPFTRSQLAEMERAAPTHVVRAIVGRDSHAPTGRPSMAPSSPQPPANVPPSGSVPGGGTGWQREIPFGPSPHQRYVDAQLDAQDAKDRRELMEQKAKAAFLGTAEPK